MSKLQSSPELLKRKFSRALSALAFYMMPASALLSVLSVDIVVLLLGEKWRIAGGLLGILALRGMFHVIEGAQGWLHLSTGHPDRWMKWGVVSAVVQVLAILAGLRFGAQGIAVGFVASGCVIAFPSIMYAGRPIGIGLKEILAAVGRQLAGATAMIAAGWWLRMHALASVPSLYRVIALTLICGAIYLGLVVVLFRLTEPLRVGARLVWEHLPAGLAVKARALTGWREQPGNVAVRGPGA